MDVRIFPNRSRPGIGLKPRRDSQRPLLPQHARHCPVLEAGSALGFLVYPPLDAQESFFVDYLGEGRCRFVFYIEQSGRREPIFGVVVTQPVGGTGMIKEEVFFATDPPRTTREKALLMYRTFVVPENLGIPAGAITLRGAWNFKTPDGWDTVYMPVFNAIERPIVPMLVIRVETDWYAHETEFRYILQPGEGISASHNMPIGQVVVVPREDVTLAECTDEELATILASQEQFARDKAQLKVVDPLGLSHSPHYLRVSRAQRPTAMHSVPLGHGGAVAATEAPQTSQIGRNDPCPCGSGKRYKKCHGALR